MVAELQSGPCVAMEVSRKDEGHNIIADFRNLCGPRDPVSGHFNFFAQRYWHTCPTLQDIARQIRPDTLRARYGKTKAQNAVHCSDLPEDGVLEVTDHILQHVSTYIPSNLRELNLITGGVFL